MKLGISMSTFPARGGPVIFSGDDWRGNLQTIQEMGYEGVDLFSHKLSASELDSIVGLMAEFNLQTTLFLAMWLAEAGSFLSDPDEGRRRVAVERYKSQIPVAARLGADMPIGYSRGWRQDGEDDRAYQDRLADSLSELCTFGDSCGVKLLLEPLNRYEANSIHRVDEALEFLQEYRLDSMGLLLDLFHMNIEEQSLENAVRRASAKIGQVHVSDSNRQTPGQGHLDFDGVIDSLAAVGFDGFLAIEAFPEPSPWEAAKSGIEFLRSKLAKSWSTQP